MKRQFDITSQSSVCTLESIFCHHFWGGSTRGFGLSGSFGQLLNFALWPIGMVFTLHFLGWAMSLLIRMICLFPKKWDEITLEYLQSILWLRFIDRWIISLIAIACKVPPVLLCGCWTLCRKERDSHQNLHLSIEYTKTIFAMLTQMIIDKEEEQVNFL